MKRERIEEIAELLDKRGKLTLEQLDGICFSWNSKVVLSAFAEALCR